MQSIPPVLDQRGKELAILMCLHRVTLSLIPERTAKSVRKQWSDHSLIQSRDRHGSVSQRCHTLDREARQRFLRERQPDAPAILVKIAEQDGHGLPFGCCLHQRGSVV